MEIRVLRYFLAVAREESISRAAQALHLSQPTLSRQLKELEEALQTTLMIRGNRKITLTEEGILLKKRAEEIVALVDKTTAEMTASEAYISGTIYIGGGESHQMSLFAEAMKELLAEHPHINFDMYSGNAESISERLDKGLLDFGVLIEPADKTKYDYLTVPAQEQWGLLLRKDHPLAHKAYITAEDLLHIPLLMSKQSLVENEISGWCGYPVDSLHIVGTYNLLYNASLMVEAGVGCALAINHIINTDNTALVFKPLYPSHHTHLVIVWKKHQIFSKPTQLFLTKIKHCINCCSK